jgi:hypothetical protein
MAALSLGFPIMKKQAMKLVYMRSQTQNSIGADTNSFSIIWSGIF